jgi:hypothetical protein
MKRKLLWACLFGTIIVVTGCGGGGGGGGGGYNSPYNSPNPYLRTEVPYTTPVKVATVDTLVNQPNTGYKVALVDTYSANISGTGSQDVIMAGRMTQPTTQSDWGDNRIHMFSWNNGTLIDQTAQWFPGGINQIIGTEGPVKFADFFKTGRQDMFIAPTTDADYYGPAYLFRNNGTSFSRQTIDLGGNIGAHGSDVVDLNGDGFKDIAMTHYGPNTTLLINDQVSGFKRYQPHNPTGDLRFGGTAIVAADFLQNGSTQFVVTDTGCRVADCNTAATRLFTWNIDTNDRLSINYHSTLPTPRFELPKWAHKRAEFGLNHAIFAVAYDFNNDRVPDVITSNRPSNTGAYSELQFLRNNGSGTFADVTDDILVGYNTNTSAAQHLRFLDLNGDGLEDILAAGGGNDSAQILLKSSDGKYVASYKNILTDFAKQAETIQAGYDSNNTSVNIIKAPNGKLYLLTGVSFIQGEGVTSDRRTSLYLSEIGSQGTISAKTAVDLILQKWPYMSPAQANEALARTSATYLNGRILDLEAALNPIGELSLPTFRGLQPIRGWISGVNFDGGSAVVMDSLGRGFNMSLQGMNVNRLNAFQLNMEHNDTYELTSHAEYLVNGPKVTHNGVRVGSEQRTNVVGQDGQGPTAVNQTFTNYTVGVPNWYRKGNFAVGTQYTALNQNPWFSIGGAWGNVTNSTILDNVVTYRNGGFSTQASFMHVSTNITPGLVTNVSNMTGGWAETGYRYTDHSRFGDIGLYAGVKPVIFSGNVTARIPTDVDNAGNVVYTNKKMTLQNPTTTYVRAMYTNLINKQTQYRLSGIVLDNGQYRIMHELRWNLN